MAEDFSSLAASRDEIHKAILEWSGSQPGWVQHALHCLASEGEVSGERYPKILEALKSTLLAGEDRTPVGRRLTAEDLGGSSPQSAVRILSIRDVKNVNCLALGQEIRFSPQGLTAVSGENGSGKTGYGRILRSVCRARSPGGKREKDRANRVLPNVYDPKAATAVPEAVLTFQREGGRSDSKHWKTGGAEAEPFFPFASVFDHHSTPIYIDEDNALEFVPFGLDLFDGLAGLFERLKSDLERETQRLRERRAGLDLRADPETPAEQFLTSLSHATTDSEVEAACSWTEDDEQELRLLSSGLEHSNNLLDLQRREVGLRALQDLCANLEGLLSDSALERIRLAVLARDEAQVARQSLVLDLSKQDGTCGLGSSAWRLLHEAAQKFVHEQGAHSYPPSSGDPCPLCRRPVDEETSRRFERFQEFVTGEVDRAAVVAKAAVDRAMQSIRDGVAGIDVATPEDLSEQFPSLAQKLTAFFNDVLEREETLAAAVAAPAISWPNSWKPLLNPLPVVHDLWKESADALEAGKRTAADRAGAERELRDLRARRRLAGNQETVWQALSMERQIAGLETCREGLNPVRITRTGRDLKSPSPGGSGAA